MPDAERLSGLREEGRRRKRRDRDAGGELARIRRHQPVDPARAIGKARQVDAREVDLRSLARLRHLLDRPEEELLHGRRLAWKAVEERPRRRGRREREQVARMPLLERRARDLLEDRPLPELLHQVGALLAVSGQEHHERDLARLRPLGRVEEERHLVRERRAVLRRHRLRVDVFPRREPIRRHRPLQRVRGGIGREGGKCCLNGN